MTANKTRLIVPVALGLFLDTVPFHPFINPPWCGCPSLNVAEVLACNAPNPGRRDWGGGLETRDAHTARVGWLVRNWANDGTDPVDVEVFRGVIVHDGWHRTAAAIARNDTVLHVEVSGDLDEAVEYGFPVAHLIPHLTAA